MPRVFTVYNCGTNFNRERTDEIIANLAARTEGAEHRDWMITDGVGSAPSSNPLAMTPGGSGLVQNWNGWMENDSPRTARLKGIVDGYGWEQNVAHALDVIQAVAVGSNADWTRSIATPSAINMAGWSRGAVTCHMLAHALEKHPYLRNIPVNIFAIDPVPGPDNFHLEQVSLPSNVHHYTALVMEDECRRIMKPVVFDPSDDEGSGKKFKMIPLPGDHNTAVFWGRSEIGTIAAALVHKFLTKHGTRLSEPMMLSDLQYCELYARVRLDIAKYRERKGNWLQRKLLGTQARNVANALRDTAYFINAHHARRFEKAFPVLSQMLNSGARSLGEVSRAAVSLRGLAPTTYQSLVQVGIL